MKYSNKFISLVISLSIVLSVLFVSNVIADSNDIRLRGYLVDKDGIQIQFNNRGPYNNEPFEAKRYDGTNAVKEHFESLSIYEQSTYAPLQPNWAYYRTVGYKCLLLDKDLNNLTPIVYHNYNTIRLEESAKMREIMGDNPTREPSVNRITLTREHLVIFNYIAVNI